MRIAGIPYRNAGNEVFFEMPQRGFSYSPRLADSLD
jgi:hypothetical protein